ncbi:hypothetical protein [Paenibacillus sp. 481]|uniref:hypothetical protein n=1 Tax=Paenibacillus sp. 481 TaxID=2835869 RepID=UPI001E600C23|nr:hypothetical protein [Paenibacillus sp. 481]UHA74611.1 hypothetical protein KIK04_05850 [Paenibacillus sp. 481]
MLLLLLVTHVTLILLVVRDLEYTVYVISFGYDGKRIYKTNIQKAPLWQMPKGGDDFTVSFMNDQLLVTIPFLSARTPTPLLF